MSLQTANKMGVDVDSFNKQERGKTFEKFC